MFYWSWYSRLRPFRGLRCLIRVHVSDRDNRAMHACSDSKLPNKPNFPFILDKNILISNILQGKNEKEDRKRERERENNFSFCGPARSVNNQLAVQVQPCRWLRGLLRIQRGPDCLGPSIVLGPRILPAQLWLWSPTCWVEIGPTNAEKIMFPFSIWETTGLSISACEFQIFLWT